MPFFDLPPAALETYSSAVADPDDFDAFWAGTLDDTRRHPLAVAFDPVDVGLPLVEVFDVTFAGFAGQPVRGWFIRPRADGPDRSACVVKYIGYGGGRGFPHEHLMWPASGRSLLVMDTRGQGSNWSLGATADPGGSGPAQPGVMTRGITDRAEYYYRRVFTDAVRAVDAARSHADIDPARIAAVGGSQGGGITLAVAGLVPDLAAAMPDVPFLCDFPRAVGLAQRDPYGEIMRYLAQHRDKAEATFRTLAYFDGVNFARRARAPALFSVALMDVVCPPSTVYGAYNAYAGSSREIAVYTFNDHEGGGAFQDRRQVDWLAGRL